MSRRIGILGGTFDPIHCGHLDVGGAAQEALGLTPMHVVTAKIPPHRIRPAASAFQRYAMVALAVANRSDWRASDLELRTERPSYTTETLEKFRARGHGSTELFFVIGADAFAEIATWRDYPRILDIAHFAVVSRPGWPVDRLAGHLPSLSRRMSRPPFDTLHGAETAIFLIDAATADVSSTTIRQRCETGDPIDGLVPAIVQQYIEQHGLYTSKTPGRRASDAATRDAAGRLHGED
jgi:nicotinate-nucleotide adenylyltransferase